MSKFSSIVLASCILLGSTSIAEANPKTLKLLRLVPSQVAFLNGTWEGNYICNGNRGLTKLKLIIEAKSSTNIDAVFLFYTHAQNSGVPSGRFRMRGNLEVSSSPDIPDLLDLKATTWINRPSGFVTVDLRGDVSSSRQKISGNVDDSVSIQKITGRVTESSCSTFEVVKRES